jgi:hypothetical protein
MEAVSHGKGRNFLAATAGFCVSPSALKLKVKVLPEAHPCFLWGAVLY